MARLQRRLARVAKLFLRVAAGVVIVGLCATGDTRAAEAGPPGHGRKLLLGIVPYFTAEKIYQLWGPVVRHLNARTGAAWELTLGKNHDELLKGLCSGEIAAAYLGPIPYGKGLPLCDLTPVAVTLGPDGKPYYHAVVVTADPGVATLKDLRGRRFAIFEKSTAAHYVPLRLLAEAGLAREELQLAPYASQDKIVAGVLAGEVAAGGVKSSLYEQFKGAGLRALKESDPLPGFVFAASPKLDADATRALAEALLAVQPRQRDTDRELVRDWDPELRWGFVAPPADHKERVQLLLRSVEPFLK